VENGRPHQGVKFVVGVVHALAVDEEVEVQITTNGVHVVVDILDLLGLTEDVHVVHFLVSHFVVGVNHVLSEVHGELVLREVPESLMNEPDMHVGDGMVDVEVIWDVHSVDEFPRIDVHQNSLEDLGCLHHRSLLASFKCFGVCEVGKHPSEFAGFLDILMNIHAFQSLIQVEWLEPWLCVIKVFLTVHSVVGLILHPIVITGCPLDLVPVGPPLLVVLFLVQLLR
jgi:hypothetical protein